MTNKYKAMTNGTRRWYIWQFFLALILVWILFVLFAPHFLNGTLYHIKSPFEAHYSNGQIHIEAMRNSKVAGEATNYARLNCGEFQYQYAPMVGSIVRGTTILTDRINIPPGYEGICYLTGFIKYEPVPLLILTHEYESVKFEIPSIQE